MSGWKSIEMGKLTNLQSKTRCRICIFKNMRICISLRFYFTSNWMFFWNFAVLIEQNRHPVFGIFHYFLPASLLSQTLLPTFLIQIKLACVQKTKTLHLQGSRRENLKKKEKKKKPNCEKQFILLHWLCIYCGFAVFQSVWRLKVSMFSYRGKTKNSPLLHVAAHLHFPRPKRQKITLSEAASEAGGQLTQPHLAFQPRGRGWTPLWLCALWFVWEVTLRCRGWTI